MRLFGSVGLLAGGALALSIVAAPMPAHALPVTVGTVAVAVPEATVTVKKKRRHDRGWRRYRGHRFTQGRVSGRSPYGCYFDDGGGRYVSCSAGGFR